MSQVYYVIECYSAGKNSHCTDRTESWVVKKRFSSNPRLDVLEYNRVHSDMVRLCDGKAELYALFCFSDDTKNYHQRRAFLDPPNTRLLREMLEKDGTVLVVE